MRKIWIRSFSRSATISRPSGWIATECGTWNSPGPIPVSPHDPIRRPPATLQDWLFTTRDFYRDLDGKPDLNVIQESIDKVQEVGFIKETLEVAKYADMSLLEEAAKRRR